MAKLWNKNKNKTIIRNVAYEDIEIKAKKLKFSKIEVDPFAMDITKDSRPVFIQLIEYFYAVYKELFIIKWQKLSKTKSDFKIIFWFIIITMIIFFIVQIIMSLIMGEKLF